MGRTAFSGPVYGAKSLLWVAGPSAAASSGTSTVAAFTQPGYGRRVVPAYEDWIVTEAYLTCSTASTVADATAWKLKVEGGSTTVPRGGGPSTNAATILTIATGGSSNVEKIGTAAVTAGEYEGTWCPAGSTLRWVSSGASLPSLPMMQVTGFIRYIDSTRGA